MKHLAVVSLFSLISGIALISGCQSYPQTYNLQPGENLYRNVKVAAISFEPVKGDVKGNADKLEAFFRKAAAEKVELALAPEGIIDGYITYQISTAKLCPEVIRDVAVPIDSPVIKRFQNLAKELNMCLAFSFAELINKDVYNSAIFIDNKGKICGRYHKMQFAEGYHPSWWFNRIGEHSRAFDTPFGRAGFMICNDRSNPNLARILALDGAQYILIPSFGHKSEKQDIYVLARARENGVAILEANVGVTMIINKGEIVKVSRDNETILTGILEIPVPPSAKNRDIQEQAFLKWREKENKNRLQATKYQRTPDKRKPIDLPVEKEWDETHKQ